MTAGPLLGIKSILYSKDKNIAGYMFLFGTIINFFIKMDSTNVDCYTSFTILLIISVLAYMVRNL